MADFFTADHHFGHARIIELTNRPFATVEEMDAVMIHRWNSVVTSSDTVYHIGDFSLGANYLEHLAGTKILIRGNHDRKHKCKGWAAVFSSSVIRYKHWNVLLIHKKPASLPKGVQMVIHGHNHNRMGEFPFINVAVEHWNYTPVEKEKLFAPYS